MTRRSSPPSTGQVSPASRKFALTALLYERTTLAAVFPNLKKSEEDFSFYGKKEKEKGENGV